MHEALCKLCKEGDTAVHRHSNPLSCSTSLNLFLSLTGVHFLQQNNVRTAHDEVAATRASSSDIKFAAVECIRTRFSRVFSHLCGRWLLFKRLARIGRRMATGCTGFLCHFDEGLRQRLLVVSSEPGTHRALTAQFCNHLPPSRQLQEVCTEGR